MHLDHSFRFQPVHTLVAIDPNIEDCQSIVPKILGKAEVVLIQANEYEVQQITLTLQEYDRLTSLHIISHGSPGCLYLGKSHLGLFSLNRYAPQLITWSVPNIILYGRDVAVGDSGTEFIHRLHQITGANIAAFTRRVNPASYSTWQLDYQLGNINPELAVLPAIQKNYTGVLGV
ncbi:DUF4347 domain-containing protein [Mastigocoleus testarum]|uniref:DUF4347 domain-containing protein n=1 Tax=Mastigocoleus testarum BC008 TaxID=371196 RepID=A0A0V7ZJ90_9CYAN|nr:DUF4347 domain-containing protein [Mastigocoleus testarum]KST63966.1 hypothetical protein BC008_39895 [Mastigocoleus testarum BC008]KST64676.1 hypothetical protein BC008_40870 [Mastigocoleus testarum BC008]